MWPSKPNSPPLGVRIFVSPTRPPEKSSPAAGFSPAAEVEKTLPFIADDYPKALAEARAQRLPLFIEAWAPW